MSDEVQPWVFQDIHGNEHTAVTHADIDCIECYGFGAKGQSSLVLRGEHLDVSDDTAQAAVMWMETGA